MATMTVKSTLDSLLEVSSVTTDNRLVNLKLGQTTGTFSAMDLLQAIHNAMNTPNPTTGGT